ncbi:alcohol dehydrogenase groES-like domain-containing protein [Ditylenchus destructor]|nr:alcohol dehydrogenase groES-like domain-containing protein [Ditylenchus destructor]
MLETLKTNASEFLAGKSIQTATAAQPIWDDNNRMHCMIWNGKFDMEYVDHARPCITDPTDVIIQVTATTICGSDLHLYKGTFPGMKKGDIQGHEFMGIVTETGGEVSKIQIGQRVVISFSIGCGQCDYCLREEYTACEATNPSQVVGKIYGDKPAAFFGYSHLTGGVPGGHADFVRVPFADVNCFPVPDEIPDEKALYLTDVIPTAYFGAEIGEVKEGSVVGIWGLGPIGLMCARWCQFLGAKRIIGIDAVPERLELAKRHLGIETIDFMEHKGKVVEVIRNLIGGALDVAIECAGFDYTQSWVHKIEIALGLETDTSEIFVQMFQSVRKFGKRASQFGVLRSGEIDPSFLVTDYGTLADGPKFFKKMCDKEGGCIKVFMRP